MSKFALQSPVLCLITDPDVPDLVEIVETALSAGITMLQLRGHQLPTNEMYRLAQALCPRCRERRAAFIVNDRLDVGLAVRADGFQLGTRSLLFRQPTPLSRLPTVRLSARKSLPLTTARSVVGDGYLLGASVHSLEAAQQAVAQGADFLIAGTIFASRSHPGGPVSGIGLLSAIKQALPSYPLLAIGGITAANAGQAMAAGADGIAVISAILAAADVARAVRELRNAIGLR